MREVGFFFGRSPHGVRGDGCFFGKSPHGVRGEGCFFASSPHGVREDGCFFGKSPHGVREDGCFFGKSPQRGIGDSGNVGGRHHTDLAHPRLATRQRHVGPAKTESACAATLEGPSEASESPFESCKNLRAPPLDSKRGGSMSL